MNSFCSFFFHLRSTSFGPLALVWAENGKLTEIHRIFLPMPDAAAEDSVFRNFPAATPRSHPSVDSLADRIGLFLRGEAIRFPLDFVRLDLCPRFQQRVLQAEHAIHRGRVSTYRLIAGHLGNAKASRAVGTALARNPFPIIIPCHRAVRSDGGLGGYQGGTRMKRALLEMEGISFREGDRVQVESFFYEESSTFRTG